ncbi:unnamed protein product [Paramecium sonneborni]|uniref:Protein kinase domain-containing protein n=1 Tax=Paramecium sonneborni TaxID=65129 RepID=A0A8S1LVK2_9CILI|nr:unnamed protein product [Paramecium sonneborni]
MSSLERKLQILQLYNDLIYLKIRENKLIFIILYIYDKIYILIYQLKLLLMVSVIQIKFQIFFMLMIAENSKYQILILIQPIRIFKNFFKYQVILKQKRQSKLIKLEYLVQNKLKIFQQLYECSFKLKIKLQTYFKQLLKLLKKVFIRHQQNRNIRIQIQNQSHRIEIDQSQINIENNYEFDTKYLVSKRAFGKVYRGNLTSDNEVAIKKIDSSIINKEQYQMIHQVSMQNENVLDFEIQIMKLLDHPNIVSLQINLIQIVHFITVIENCADGDLKIL